MQISKNFTLEELYVSETAKRLHIDNTPNDQETESLKRLVLEILQPIRDRYGKPIKINSGFRCLALNKATGGSSTSQHKLAQAADISVVRGKNRELFWIIYDMINSGELKVGQLIWEFGDNKEPSWIHISLPYTKINNILQAKKINGVTKYIPFKLSR